MRYLLLPALAVATLLPQLVRAQAPGTEPAASHARRGTGTIKGAIRTSDGHPAAFVSVGLPRLGKGANTGEDGAFEIKGVEPGSHLLQVSFVGRQPQQQTVLVTAGHHPG